MILENIRQSVTLFLYMMTWPWLFHYGISGTSQDSWRSEQKDFKEEFRFMILDKN